MCNADIAVFWEENYNQIRLVKLQKKARMYPLRSTRSRDIAIQTSGGSQSRIFPSTLNHTQQKNMEQTQQTKTLLHMQTITLYPNINMAKQENTK